MPPIAAIRAEPRSAAFPRLLETRLAGRARRKGRRTRAALRIAAARLIHLNGYDRVHTADIADAAGLSKAAFYVYFRDKADVAVSVLRPFVAVAFPARSPCFEAVDPVRSAFARLAPLIGENRRLIQALEPLRDDAPDFAARCEARILRWHEGLLSSAGLDPRLAPLLAATSLGLAWRSPDAAAGGVAEEVSRLWRPAGAAPRQAVRAAPVLVSLVGA
ncbi:transcriptional regulator, TetR family [Phenylobacterium zucineum HLK1]|uniref:Transcriptional regulator, TetR family n=1 Tax=Phenylobacterium zucineum (strain HLK1) TaxID=450851 RepID=B4RFL0_PHEZH|nr:TetR/AcrR family transcriptional regulator [Phenylobacterium zucineum]ACG77091.1 transcriptional regulator, TetR family [Phenylobacterium zucineum HLK1]